MSIALVQHNGRQIWRFFVHSPSLRRNCAVSGEIPGGIRADLLMRTPLDALRTCELASEAICLADLAKDWRWLSQSETAAALTQDVQLLEDFS